MNSVLSDLHATKTPRALWRLLKAWYAERGVSKISYHHYAGTGAQADRPVTVNAEGFPEDWVCHYIQEKLFLIDPITELARSRSAPFLWSEIDRLMKLTPEQRQYLDDLRAADLGNGIAFQVYGPGMRNGYVGLGLAPEAEIPGPQALLEMQCVAQAGHLRYCELTREEIPPAPALSSREREILHWIAQGKSNAVIAEILGVSAHTIDTMVRRIFAKLDVADRTTAAIRGVGAGLILPPA